MALAVSLSLYCTMIHSPSVGAGMVKPVSVLLTSSFTGLSTGSGGDGDGLGLDLHGLHVLVENGNLELAVLGGDFAVHGFVGAEFEDAAFVRPSSISPWPKAKLAVRARQDGGQFGFHGMVVLYV